ncbi:hypothetical protein BST61_g9758 [Cercospora zeina]
MEIYGVTTRNMAPMIDDRGWTVRGALFFKDRNLNPENKRAWLDRKIWHVRKANVVFLHKQQFTRSAYQGQKHLKMPDIFARFVRLLDIFFGMKPDGHGGKQCFIGIRYSDISLCLTCLGQWEMLFLSSRLDRLKLLIICCPAASQTNFCMPRYTA